MIAKELQTMDGLGRIRVKFGEEKPEDFIDVLSLRIVPGEDSRPEDLKFTWKPTKINEDGIQL